MSDNGTASELLRQAKSGDTNALGQLLMLEGDRLTRMARLRMDPRLRVRVDARDVVQEAFIDATRRFEQYAHDDNMPFFLWLRFLTMQKLHEIHRRHFGVKARDVTREVSLCAGPTPEASSAVLAAQLIGELTTPSQAAVRAETRLQLEAALNSLDDTDREVLALRHFEQLSNGEAARVLGIGESAASNRYVRAVKRLKGLLDRR